MRPSRDHYSACVVGGGAAGFFAAIACARASGGAASVVVLEKGPHFLSKVRISGGGRCNVTHSCFETRALAAHYPRGERALLGAFSRFAAADTVEWFQSRGVKLKTESDGRMFPITDSSQTIIDCLMGEAREAGVELVSQCGAGKIARKAQSEGFEVTLSDGKTISCDRLLLATGGPRSASSSEPAVALGHTFEPPVPSLFTFHIETPWLRDLAGVSVEPVEASVPGTRLRERGPLLATHWGVSGPVILRLSAWGARELHGMEYRFPLRINWLPGLTREAIAEELRARRQSTPVIKTPIKPIPSRLWEQLVFAARIAPDTRWAALSRPALLKLADQLSATEFHVTGKSTNKAEFVTCGGVRLSEVNFKTMESKIVPGLHFAGELLDIDGITGGFNFQAAWTTGWIAGNAMAATKSG